MRIPLLKTMQSIWQGLTSAGSHLGLIPGTRAKVGVTLVRSLDGYAAANEFNVWVSSGVDLRAEAVAQVPLVVETLDKGGKVVDSTTDHPALALIAKGNLFVKGHYNNFVWTESTLSLMGNTYWYVQRGNSGDAIVGEPSAIWLLHARDITLQRGNGPGGFVFRWQPPQGPNDLFIEPKDIPPELIVPFIRMDSSSSPFVGKSLLRSVLDSVGADINADIYNANFFNNSAEPSLVITVPGQFGPGQKKQFLALMQEQQGGVGNAHKNLVLSHGATATKVSTTPQEAGWTEAGKVNRDKVLAALRVPSELLVGRASNRATAQEAVISFQDNTIEPELRLLESALNTHYLPMFGVAAMANQRLRFDRSVAASHQVKMLERIKAGAEAAGVPIMAINEAREFVGTRLPKITDKTEADDIFVPSNMLSIE